MIPQLRPMLQQTVAQWAAKGEFPLYSSVSDIHLIVWNAHRMYDSNGLSPLFVALCQLCTPPIALCKKAGRPAGCHTAHAASAASIGTVRVVTVG